MLFAPACPSGKEAYPTATAAQRVIARIRTRKGRRRDYPAGNAYQCRDCRQWHITSLRT